MNLIVDGNNLAHRARHAYSLSFQGVDTSVTFGVMRMLLGLVKKYKPNSVIFAWDGGTPGFRRRLVPSYKAGRKRKREDDGTWAIFITQLQELEAILPHTGVLQVKRRGIEADDLMAHAAKGLIGDNLIISTDDDMLQCVNDNTSMLKPGKKAITYTVENFEELIGFPVYRFVLSKVLQGDSSDEIPGVRGIGPKTALKLMQGGDTLLGAATPRMQERIEKFIADGYYNKAYTAIDLSVDLAGAKRTLKDAEWMSYDKSVRKWCIDKGFISIIEGFSLSILGGLKKPEFEFTGRLPRIWDYRRSGDD